jgi:hypothetical protein
VQVFTADANPPIKLRELIGGNTGLTGAILDVNLDPKGRGTPGQNTSEMVVFQASTGAGSNNRLSGFLRNGGVPNRPFEDSPAFYTIQGDQSALGSTFLFDSAGPFVSKMMFDRYSGFCYVCSPQIFELVQFNFLGSTSQTPTAEFGFSFMPNFAALDRTR